MQVRQIFYGAITYIWRSTLFIEQGETIKFMKFPNNIFIYYLVN